MTRKIFYLLLFFYLTTPLSAQTSQPAPLNSSEIRLALEKLNTLGTVMYIAAHPDDENTRLISYLANERKFRTIYLSLTRGSGGQNLIGTEQGPLLGMIRTQELLAARRNDGGEQTFSRCVDFGYSKNSEETFSKWDHNKALADVVWAIRIYRPDVIITRFPSTGEGGHGHHTASAILAEEAFVAAGDPSKFPEQLKYVSVWKPVRMFWNTFNFRFRPDQDFTGQLQINVGGYNPLLGESYGEIASRATSNHKSQGFGVAARRGLQYEYLKRTMGDTTVTEFFERIDSTWSRVDGSTGIANTINNILKNYDHSAPAASVPALLELREMLNALPESNWKDIKTLETDKLISACAGLWFEVNPDTFFSVPGSNVKLEVNAISRAYNNVRLSGLTIGNFDTTFNSPLETNLLFTYDKIYSLSEELNYTNPYWLSNKSDGNMYDITDPLMNGLAWNNSLPEAVFTFDIDSTQIKYTVPLIYKWTDPVKGQCYRPFEILPPVTVNVTDEVLTFTGPGKKEMPVIIRSNVEGLKGTLKFKAPAGWNVSWPEKEINIPAKGGEIQISAEITPPVLSDVNAKGSDNFLTVSFEYGGKEYNNSITRIDHDHIPAMVYLEPCKIKLVAFDLQTAVTRIGYINGAGDKVAECLRQAGFTVDILDEETIKTGDLSGYGAIITGIRAYNTIENISNYHAPLMAYIRNGGNLIVQYNTNNFVSSLDTRIGPYDFKISRKRVTDENAKVNFVEASSSLISSPNKITKYDFDGWVQERGLYFAEDCAPEYKKVFSWNDKGEEPLDGALIYTKYGEGYFIYTGISFFRQLPAGVPGAYRLITNLINAGKP